VSGTPAHLATNIRHWRNWEIGAYLQDDWKISKRLTLNLGIRYDLYTRHTELNNLATTFLKGPGNNFIDNITTGAGQIKDASTPCPGNPLATIAGECGPGGFAPAKVLGRGDHNNFGPRVGFAWDVFGNGKTSLRGGFGLSYEGTLYNPLSNTRWNPPFYSLNSISNSLAGDVNDVVYGPVDGSQPTFLGPAPPAQHSGTGIQATGNISGWDPSNPQLAGLSSIVFPEGIRDPYAENWFLGVQRELRRSITVEVNYVGTAGRKLFRAESVNRVPGARLPEGTCVTRHRSRKRTDRCESFAKRLKSSKLNQHRLKQEKLCALIYKRFLQLRLLRDAARLEKSLHIFAHDRRALEHRFASQRVSFLIPAARYPCELYLIKLLR
jgi:hypothetical protein